MLVGEEEKTFLNIKYWLICTHILQKSQVWKMCIACSATTELSLIKVTIK